MLDLIGGPDRDRTDDLFHAMEARSQLRHRPTNGGMQPLYCLCSGGIRQTPCASGADSRLQREEDSIPAPRRVRNLSRFQPDEKNFRDREHLRGGPVSKTIESVWRVAYQPAPSSRALQGSIGS